MGEVLWLLGSTSLRYPSFYHDVVLRALISSYLISPCPLLFSSGRLQSVKIDFTSAYSFIHRIYVQTNPSKGSSVREDPMLALLMSWVNKSPTTRLFPARIYTHLCSGACRMVIARTQHHNQSPSSRSVSPFPPPPSQTHLHALPSVFLQCPTTFRSLRLTSSCV